MGAPTLLHRALQHDQLVFRALDERDIDESGQFRLITNSSVTGRQLLERSTAVLQGLDAVLPPSSQRTLVLVYGTMCTMRYRVLLLASALGALDASFLPLYHNLGEALRRLRLQWPAERQPRVALFAPGLYAQEACELGLQLLIATSGVVPRCPGVPALDYEALTARGRALPTLWAPPPTGDGSAAFYAARQDEDNQPTFVVVPWETSVRFACRALRIDCAAAAAAALAGEVQAPRQAHVGGLGFYPASSVDSVSSFAAAISGLAPERTHAMTTLSLGLARSSALLSGLSPRVASASPPLWRAAEEEAALQGARDGGAYTVGRRAACIVGGGAPSPRNLALLRGACGLVRETWGSYEQFQIARGDRGVYVLQARARPSRQLARQLVRSPASSPAGSRSLPPAHPPARAISRQLTRRLAQSPASSPPPRAVR